jgi:hypothetical protein
MNSIKVGSLRKTTVHEIKYPKTFGFLPEAGADQNVNALQTAVSGGGLIIIDTPGIYELNNTIVLDSNTKLICSPGVVFKKVASYCNVLINRGALTREYNENITIDGLEISVNGHEAMPTLVYGLRAQLGFFCIKNLHIKNFVCADGGPHQYLMYIVRWEHLFIENVRLAGDKDGIKLNNGHDASIKNLDLTTYDDGLSLCGTDYASTVVEVGDVYDVCYSNVTDHQYKDIFGRTCLIYTGSWADYANGNEYRSSDFCLNVGKLYQCVNNHGFVGKSSAAPIHNCGIATGTDSISWRYVQECDFYHTDVYNVTFDNCIFEKSGNLIAVWDERSDFQRNYYPGTEKLSSVWGLSITNCKVHASAQQVLICSMTNLKDVIISNCVLDGLEAVLRIDSSAYNESMNVSITGCTFRNMKDYLVALHDGKKVVDWALPFTKVGAKGYLPPDLSAEDSGLRTQNPITVNCTLSGNNYSNSVFKYNVSCGAKLRFVNLDLPFSSFDHLTPLTGDICRHIDGLFVYTSQGWVNLSLSKL